MTFTPSTIALAVFLLIALVALGLGFLSWRYEEHHYHQRRVAKPVRPIRDLHALILGGAMLGAGLVMGLEIVPLAMLTLSAFAGFWLVFGFEAQGVKVGERHGGVPEMVIQAEIQSAAESLDILATVNEQIPDAEVTATLNRIDQKCEVILNRVLEEPKKFRRVRGFLSGHLARVAEISTDFIGLSSERQTEGLTKLKRGLIAVDKALDQELDALDRDEVLDVEVALKVLERQLA